MWSDWQQVQQMATIVQCARTCKSFFSLAEASTRMVEEWCRNPAVRTRRRWTLMVVAKARERDASCADVPATQRKTASSIKPRQGPKERQRVCRLTRTLQPSLKASVAIVARMVTGGLTAGSVWQKRKTRNSTLLMEHRQQQAIVPMMRQQR